MMNKRLTAGVVIVVVLLVGALAPARAQEQRVRFDGRVQWIAGQAMAVQLDGGGSVNVDLARVPQSEYAALSPNERVRVLGVITDWSRRVVGTSVVRGDDLQAP